MVRGAGLPPSIVWSKSLPDQCRISIPHNTLSPLRGAPVGGPLPPLPLPSRIKILHWRVPGRVDAVHENCMVGGRDTSA